MRPLLVLFGLALGLSGCLGSNREWVSPKTKRTGIVGVQSAGEAESRFSWRRVSIGLLPRPTFHGYLKSRRVTAEDVGGPIDPEDRREAHWVYDAEFKLVACMSPNGSTVRFERFGREEGLGNMQLDDALRAVFDVRGKDQEVHFSAVQAPKG